MTDTPPNLEGFCDVKTFVQYWKNWLQYTRRFSRHTLSAYELDIQDFLNFIQKHLGKNITFTDLETLTIRDFRSWLAQRHHQEYKVRSTARSLSVVRNFFHFMRKKTTYSNQAIGSLRSPRVQMGLPKPLTPEQATTFIEDPETTPTEPWVAARDRALFILLYGAGLRISEALALNQDCLPMSSSIRIVGKGKKERVVPILPQITEAIRLYRQLCPLILLKDDPLFIGVRGKRLNPSVVQKTMRTYRRLTGLPDSATPHALRHSFASHLMDACGDLRAIQELLGHTSLSTTQIYTKVETHKLLSIYHKSHPRD